MDKTVSIYLFIYSKHYNEKAYLRACKDAGRFLSSIIGARDTKLMKISGNNRTAAKELWRNMYLLAGGR